MDRPGPGFELELCNFEPRFSGRDAVAAHPGCESSEYIASVDSTSLVVPACSGENADRVLAPEYSARDALRLGSWPVERARDVDSVKADLEQRIISWAIVFFERFGPL